MGIKLDWEVEADGGWDEIGEDPAAIAARKRRLKIFRNIALALLVIALAVGAAIFYRLRQTARQREDDLRAVIAAETLALRIGDRTAYLSLQADVGEWVRIQDSSFAQYQAFGGRIDTPGEIAEMDINADKARVVLLERLDEQDFHVVWFYQYQNGAWQHIPPSVEFWGEQIHEESAHIELTYYERDADLAGLLKVRLNGWWETACRMTDCNEQPPRIHVRIEPDPLTGLGWAAYSSTTLIVPSPQSGRMPVDSQFDPAVLDQLAGLLAGHWAAHEFEGEPEPYSEAAWLEAELAAWLETIFTGAESGVNFFDPLLQIYGPQMVRGLLNRVDNGEEVRPVITDLTGEPVTSLDLPWASYLTYRLRAESILITNGHATEAVLLYRDHSRSESESLPNIPTEIIANPETIEVIGTHTFGSVLWAEVRFQQADGAGERSHIAFEPFRLDEGRWGHSSPLAEDWGEARTLRSEHFTLDYYAIDEPAVDGLLPYLETTYAQTAADLGLGDPLPPVQVAVIPAANTGGHSVGLVTGRPLAADQAEIPAEIPAADQEALLVVVPSAYSTMRDADLSVGEFTREVAAREFIKKVVVQELSPLAANHPFVVAFMHWEMERASLDAEAAIQSLLATTGRTGPAWPVDGSGPLVFSQPYTDDHYMAAYILLEVLAEQKGPGIIPPMMAYLPFAVNVDDWLLNSAGITSAEISDAWNQAYHAALSDSD